MPPMCIARLFRCWSASRGKKAPPAPPKAIDSPDVQAARGFLRGEQRTPSEIQTIAKRLAGAKNFHLAWQILARAGRVVAEKDPLKLELAREQVLCTYKDPDLPAEVRYTRALEILENECELETTNDQETLGLAGAVYKYRWQSDGHLRNLKRSLFYYLRGYEAGDPNHENYDNGWTGVNAAFVLDMLSRLEEADAHVARYESKVGLERREKAKAIRESLVKILSERVEQPTHGHLATKWWFQLTLAELYFGLGRDPEAVEHLKRAKALPNVPDWEKESSVRQFAALAQLREAEGNAESPWTVLSAGFDIPKLAAQIAVAGKVGLALSGGGFRASLFHIGVLARLAELDVLRHVEVLSCVSGGSIIGAYYYLEIRKLLRLKPDQGDGQIERKDYIQIVQRIAEQFLAGVQQDLRNEVVSNSLSNLGMCFRQGNTPTERIAELYEKRLFARVDDGENGERWLDSLLINPKHEPAEFQPKLHNWRREAKAPILIHNATTLNTCHNWQFTASYLGESPFLIDSEIDGNERLRRMYYREAPAGYRNFRLGRAVAASSCVPGIFTPLTLPSLYPDRVVRLVDGGVFDNQGVAGLLEQDCTVLLISDGSGQTAVEASPSQSPLSALWRSDSVLQARLRQVQFADLKARRRSGLLRGMMVVHLKKDLDVDPIDWEDCPDPFDASEETRPVERRGPLTPYGVQKKIQRTLSALRTDLDAFSDLEALALMCSGYLMAEHEFPKGLADLPISKAGSVPWRFLAALRDRMKEPLADDEQRLLEVGRRQLLKIWILSRPLMILASLLGVVVLVAVVASVMLWWHQSIGTVGGFLKWLAIFLAVSLVSSAVLRILRVERNMVFTLGSGAFGWLTGRIHRRILDPLYLKRGALPHLTHDQVLAWIREHNGWQRVRKTKSIHARAIELDEQNKAFYTAERTTQFPKQGHWLCAGVVGEPWFQEKTKLDSKYALAGEEEMQFSFDDRPRKYQIYKPNGAAQNWAVQVADGRQFASFTFQPSYETDWPLMAPAGAYIVTDYSDTPPDDPAKLKDIWLVQQAIFESTYEPVPDDSPPPPVAQAS